MITRKLLAALVGLSLAAGTFGTASAQTAPAPLSAQSASPSDTVAPTTATKTDTPKKAPVRKAHHARMTAKTHRKHVALRAHNGSKTAAKKIAAEKTASKKIASKPVAAKGLGTEVSTRVSHASKRGSTIKHV